jgi:hypothetical protein|tara:strand:- start:945 stop:1121 length:177 start_codon:yes stop_codon:yes gene_type:complete
MSASDSFLGDTKEDFLDEITTLIDLAIAEENQTDREYFLLEINNKLTAIISDLPEYSS